MRPSGTGLRPSAPWRGPSVAPADEVKQNLRRLGMGISPVAGGRRRRLRPYLAVAAAVALGAGAAAGATAASASTAAAKVSFAGYHVPAKVSASLPQQDRDPDQARRGDLRRERVVRPLLRHLPRRGEHGRHPVHRQAGHAGRQRPVLEDHEEERPDRPAADGQPEPVRPAAADQLRGAHLGPEPQLHRRSSWPRTTGRWTCSSSRPSPRPRPTAAASSTARPGSSWTTTTATPSPRCGTTLRTTR